MEKQEILGVLRQCKNYIHGSEDFGFINAVYVTPAQQLRNEADAIERKDAFVKKLNETIEALQTEI